MNAMAPAVKRVRAYFAPVNRASKQAAIFDPAANGAFDLDAPPPPWIDLGWITGFARASGTEIVPVRTGSPATTQMQVRVEADATVRFVFETWGKLQMSLTAGTQQMNLLAVQPRATPAGSGGSAMPAVALLGDSAANSLDVGTTAAGAFSAGSLVVVDTDYVAGTTGFIGAGVSGAYLKQTVTDVDYVRRVSLNIGRVQAVSNGVLTLEAPLLAGTPVAGMKVSAVLGFCDREGSSFFQEWSALFVGEGQQGERIVWHYPRLQTAAGIAETTAKSPGGYDAWRLAGSFRALPITDALDNERVLCF